MYLLLVLAFVAGVLLAEPTKRAAAAVDDWLDPVLEVVIVTLFAPIGIPLVWL